MCVCLLGSPNFKRPICLSTSGLGNRKVARVGRPATDYKLVVRLHVCLHACVKCVCEVCN